MRALRATLVVGGALAAIGAGGRLAARLTNDRFDHWQHRRVFPTCQGCHTGATDSTQSIWPAASDCETCHDGIVEKKIVWSPPARSRPSNLRFSHLAHTAKAAERLPRDSVVCASCHLAERAPWMRVRRTEVRRCLDCHDIRTEHLSAANTACGTCHLTLAEATALPREQVGRFPTPPYHLDPSFAQEHGKLAEPAPVGAAAPVGVSPSCATCHARDFCITCHVNAPEVPAIQALAPDPRSLAIETKLEAPASHAAPEFVQRHGQAARRAPQSCAACHTRESCFTCHVAQPAVAVAMHAAGPGRGPGASVERRRPASHGDDFTTRHAPVASATPKSCAACHARADCLDCHRPSAASAPGYHPAGFLARHPASAYARETSCAECHNTGAFCADCHQQAGLASRGTLGAGFHDAKQAFLLGHGPAARQSLESCVSCHAERDCLTCHSALGGRRFNPHGPGFDAERLRKRNPQMCSACHGAAIPGQ
ncbi:MAG TPA: cytochrome c3 family protein [Gemmatimonadales bacterium]|nr:cytochrome c3 family protein [Gemmatimonadales bacterium]